MKTLYLLILGIGALISNCSSNTSIEETFMSIVNDCKEKESASDADVDVVINHEVPNSPTQNCLFACFYETLGVIQDGKMSIDSLKTVILAKFSGDGNAITTINGLIDECATLNGSDRCELAHNILECLNNGANKHGINKKQL
ncbi:general odorant-binding protein 19d-like [Contarinia nasturtii]|uniref:general odorant-binding protein 19d-like n=1 Tax=Contarinia nasturtii TaxID=265458 RepID=UPI0012D43C30|nr:general odorant-binding protein 19d-like [Contarinia nasturtii]